MATVDAEFLIMLVQAKTVLWMNFLNIEMLRKMSVEK